MIKSILITLLFITSSISALAETPALSILNNSELALAYSFLPVDAKEQIDTENTSEVTSLAKDFLANGGVYSVVDLKKVVDEYIFSDQIGRGFFTELLYSNVRKGIKLSASNSNIFIINMALLDGYDSKKFKLEKVKLKALGLLLEASLKKNGITARYDSNDINSQYGLSTNLINENLNLMNTRMTVLFDHRLFTKKEFTQKLQAALNDFKQRVDSNFADLEFPEAQLEVDKVNQIISLKHKREKAAAKLYNTKKANKELPLVDQVKAIVKVIQTDLYFNVESQTVENRLVLRVLNASGDRQILSILPKYDKL